MASHVPFLPRYAPAAGEVAAQGMPPTLPHAQGSPIRRPGVFPCSLPPRAVPKSILFARRRENLSKFAFLFGNFVV